MKQRITGVLALLVAVVGILALARTPHPATASQPGAVAPATASDPPPGSPAN